MPARKIGSSSRVSKRSSSGSKKSAELLALVNAGVRRFILDGSPIGDFQKTVREAARKGLLSSHPLSGMEFRRIVKEALEKRARRRAQRPKQPKTRKKGRM